MENDVNLLNNELKFNETQKSLSEKLEQTLEAGEKISKVMNGLEIHPSNTLLLVKPYNKNPYEKMEIRESGIYTGASESNKYFNTDSGEEEELKAGIIVARVLEVGPECKYVEEGDDIFYTFASQTTVPFFGQGFYVVPEQRVLVIINEGLQNRMKIFKQK